MFSFIDDPNVSVQAEARFGADSLKRLVGAFHFWPSYMIPGSSSVLLGGRV